MGLFELKVSHMQLLAGCAGEPWSLQCPARRAEEGRMPAMLPPCQLTNLPEMEESSHCPSQGANAEARSQKFSSWLYARTARYYRQAAGDGPHHYRFSLFYFFLLLLLLLKTVYRNTGSLYINSQ